MRRAAGAVMTYACLLAAPVAAQQRPLVTQDPALVGQGQVIVEAGVETGADAFYPVSGLTGDRVSVPVAVTIGIAPNVDVQASTGYEWLSIGRREPAPLDFRVRRGGSTSDNIDVTLAMKMRVLSEGDRRPAVGLRFLVQLPTASNESGLGLDTLNFDAVILAGKTVKSFRIVGNAGLGIAGDVLQGSTQQDFFIGGVSVVRALSPSVDLLGEFAGRAVLFAETAPIGAEPRGQVRAAVRYTRGTWRVDGGVLLGTTRQDPGFGLIVGLSRSLSR